VDFSIQRQITANTLLSVSYVGLSGITLFLTPTKILATLHSASV